jgi:hypothetical protein
MIEHSEWHIVGIGERLNRAQTPAELNNVFNLRKDKYLAQSR